MFFCLKSNAQLLVDFQIDSCTNDSVEKSWTFKNHIENSSKTLEINIKDENNSKKTLVFLQKNFGMEVVSLFKNFHGFTLKELLFLNGMTGDFSNLTADDQCFYSIHVVSISDSSDFFYVGKKILLPIYVSINDSNLHKTDSILLAEIATIMLRYHFLQFEINVHFDERYSKEYSRCLSCKRAMEIKNYLILKGVAANRMTTNGFEGNKPTFKRVKTEEEHSRNRKTEIVITGIDLKAKDRFKYQLKKTKRKLTK